MIGSQRRQGRHPHHGAWLSLMQVAAYTPVGPDFIAEQIRNGRGPECYLFGQRMWFLLKDVEQWIESLKRAGGSPQSAPIGRCPKCGRPPA